MTKDRSFANAEKSFQEMNLAFAEIAKVNQFPEKSLRHQFTQTINLIKKAILSVQYFQRSESMRIPEELITITKDEILKNRSFNGVFITVEESLLEINSSFSEIAKADLLSTGSLRSQFIQLIALVDRIILLARFFQTSISKTWPWK